MINNIDVAHICTACGTQFPASPAAPGLCRICADDRQFIPENGQDWTSLDELQSNYGMIIKLTAPALYELKMAPDFAIAQRAFLIVTPGGNILWDCIPLINEATIDFINARGGLKAIVFSHPHYFSTMNEWSRRFDCPVFIHQEDEQWVANKGSATNFWTGAEQQFWDGIRAIHIGGHFPGSCIMYIPALSEKGVILCGDSLYISKSRRHIAVMHSYPNQIPLPRTTIGRISEQVSRLEFDTIYGAFGWQGVTENVKELFATSMKRYLAG